MASSESSNIDAPLRVRIHTQCGACNHLLLPGDHLVALLCNEKSVRAYNALTLEANGRCKLLEHENVNLCMSPKCDFCSKHGEGDESVTVHADCFSLFGKTCTAKDKYRRLWVSGIKIYPWRNILPLELAPGRHVSSELINSIAGFHRTFLPEVAGLIGGHLPVDHLLLRFCNVLRLAEELSSAEITCNDAITYPLCEILSWSRGTSPILVEHQTVNPRLRITIDSRGIQRVERVSDRSQETTSDVPVASYVYVVESVAQLSGVSIEFQLGMSRLQVPTSANISIWNIPSPHNLPSTTRIMFNGKPSSGRFAALDLDPSHCTGISFFISINKILAIHGHTARGSHAPQAFQHLKHLHYGGISWIYIPIAANDKVIGIGTRRPINGGIFYTIVLKTKSGINFIGYPYVMVKGDINQTLHITHKADDRHLTLIHEVVYNKCISFIEADNIIETTSSITINRQHLAYMACHHYASLEGVANAYVFTDYERRGVCNGILLEYEDGTERALGQCRLGLDPVQCYEHPTNFYYAGAKCVNRSGREYKSVRAAFDSETGLFSTHDTAEWETCQMKGVIQFSFYYRLSGIKIHDAWDPSFG
ncbi:hypothetical protein GGI43DRAFT_389466 [Trichoderma evansii]